MGPVLRLFKFHKLIFLTILIVVPSSYSLGQFREDLLSNKINLLRKQGIDTILIYPRDQIYTLSQDKSIFIGSSEYLMWRTKDGCRIQKFSTCLNEDGARCFDTAFKELSIGCEDSFNYFLSNIETIKTEKLRPALIVQKVDGRDTMYEAKPGYHSQLMGVRFYIHGNEFKNYFYDMNLWDGSIRNDDGSLRIKFESLNFSYNNSTAVVKLNRLLWELVDSLEESNSFAEKIF